tara:strand:- start:527 stop:646 length:120 start_codon:yes stop_codon:yes gene_type:complete
VPPPKKEILNGVRIKIIINFLLKYEINVNKNKKDENKNH